MKSLEDYLKSREEKLSKLRSEVALLKSAKLPLKVREYGDGSVGLFSDNYSLATDFKIQKRCSHISGTSGYDGGYSTDRYESYPQFYFTLRRGELSKPVYIEHNGFDEDKRVVIKSVTVTRGSKDYSDMNSTNEDSIDVQKVFDFFRERGVKPSLLDRLARRMKEAEEF